MDLCFITAPSDYNSQKPLIKPYAVKAFFHNYLFEIESHAPTFTDLCKSQHQPGSGSPRKFLSSGKQFVLTGVCLGTFYHRRSDFMPHRLPPTHNRQVEVVYSRGLVEFDERLWYFKKATAVFSLYRRGL